MNKKHSCDVSIVCANYNNGRYLDEFIYSVEQSSALPKELIIIDDGSTDNSMEILSKYELTYLSVIALEANIGFANALNVGIKKATAKYILRVDPDDLLEKRRIEKQYSFLEKNSDVGIVGSNALYFHSKNNQSLSGSNFPLSFSHIKKRYILGEHGVLHGTVMGKTTLFKKFEYVQENVPAEDYEIFAKMIKHDVKFANLGERLTKVRIHENSVSNVLPKSTIIKTFTIRDTIFNKKTSWFRLNTTYYCGFYYRKYMYDDRFFNKYFFLLISIILRPDKLWRRLG
jgi:glycosyltransferase involved in cell wall biosynthesis